MSKYNQHEQTDISNVKGMVKAYFTKEEWYQALKKSKFYIIRSSNFDNIIISRNYREWATTRANEGRLNEAFNISPHVFLIFSVSKMSEFKGIARMESASTKDQGHFWRNTETIKLGGCF